MPVATSNTVTVTVGQVADVNAAPASGNIAVEPGATGYIAISIENKGNGADTFGLAMGGGSGWSPAIIHDANGDGVRQSTETTKVTSTGSVARGSSYKCFIALTAPAGTADGTSVSATLTATSAFDSTKKAQGAYSAKVDNAPSTESIYIKEWLMNGYYSNTDPVTRLSTDYLGNEATVAPLAGTTNGGKTWGVLKSDTDDTCFLTAYGSQINHAVTYACTYVYSPSAQSAQLWMGSDDGLKVWMNGQHVKTSDVHRSHAFDQDKVPVNLTAGWNRLLVKVSQRYVDWKVSAKVCDSSGNALDGIKVSTSPDVSAPPVISGVTIANLTSTSATIGWNTDKPTTGSVKYGLSSTSLSTTVRSDTLQTQTSVNLSGLTAGTTYYYSVYASDISGSTSNTQVATFSTAPSSTTSTSYIKTWLMNGYHANTDMNTVLSRNYLVDGEAYAAPTAGMVQGGKTWTGIQSSADYLDFLSIYGSSVEYAAAYACAYIYSPSARSVELRVGSDDGAKIWLNGKTIYTNNVFQSYVPDQNKVAAELFAGWNRLLLKVSQRQGGWRASVKICDTSGNAVPGVYAVTNTGDKAAPVVSNVQVTNVTSTGMTVTWTTDKPTSADVFYGTSSLTSRAGYGAMSYQHSVTVKNLSPSTNYYFTVGGADASGNRGERAGYQQSTSAQSLLSLVLNKHRDAN